MTLKTFLPIQSIYHNLSETPNGTAVYRKSDKIRGSVIGITEHEKILCDFLNDDGCSDISFESPKEVELLIEIKPKK